MEFNNIQPGALALLIPIVSIVLGIGIAFWSIYWDYRVKKLQYNERQLMIEKGMPVPPTLPDRKRRTPKDSLRAGIILVFLGIGLGIGYFVLLQAASGPSMWICGVGAAVVGFLGIGNLIYYFIARKHGPEENNRIMTV